jgi:hypothetical protein
MAREAGGGEGGGGGSGLLDHYGEFVVFVVVFLAHLASKSTVNHVHVLILLAS